jgi:cation:H+ antiporter
LIASSDCKGKKFSVHLYRELFFGVLDYQHAESYKERAVVWILLIISLLIILLASEMFTNAIEWLGLKLKLGSGATGSILAAVGTALPETMVPLVAIATRGGAGEVRAGEHIGIGAILGAPFMLSTLAMFVTGVAVLAYHKSRNRPIELNHDWRVFRRDLEFFLVCFALALAAGFTPENQIGKLTQIALGAALLVAYGIYVYKTIKGESEHLEEPGRLHFACFIANPVRRQVLAYRVRRTGGTHTHHIARESDDPHMALIVIQLAVALALILVGAKFFVTQVSVISLNLGISALVLALVVAPIATELPEKFNSVIWIGQKKDTLALGNITGAMVFQSAFPVTVGLWFTDWNLTQDTHAIYSAIITLVAGIYLLLLARFRKHIEAWWLMVPVLLYILFLVSIIFDRRAAL